MKVTHIGGRMYGDGEYVVEFHVSQVAPLSFSIQGPNIAATGQFTHHVTKPSVELARLAIENARAQS